MKGKPVSIEGIQKRYLFWLKTVFKNQYLKIEVKPLFFFLFFLAFIRLRVVPHFSSRIVEGAKRERA